MTREECEMLILQHVKEIRDIAKQYDTSKEFYLSMCCVNNSIILIMSFGIPIPQ